MKQQQKNSNKPNKVSNTKLFEEYISAKDSKDSKAIINARNKLIMHNQPLVTHVINKYFSKGMIAKSSMQDLIQEGCFGLAEAIERFKPDKGFKFSTYAAWWIRQAVGSALKENETPIVIPPHIINMQNKYVTMAQSKGITYEEAVEGEYKSGNLSEKMMHSAIAAINTTKILSLDQGSKNSSKSGSDPGASNRKTELINANLSVAPKEEAGIDKTILVHTMKEALKKLGPKKRNVLLLRFGIIEEPILLSDEVTSNNAKKDKKL